MHIRAKFQAKTSRRSVSRREVYFRTSRTASDGEEHYSSLPPPTPLSPLSCIKRAAGQAGENIRVREDRAVGHAEGHPYLLFESHLQPSKASSFPHPQIMKSIVLLALVALASSGPVQKRQVMYPVPHPFPIPVQVPSAPMLVVEADQQTRSEDQQVHQVADHSLLDQAAPVVQTNINNEKDHAIVQENTNTGINQEQMPALGLNEGQVRDSSLVSTTTALPTILSTTTLSSVNSGLDFNSGLNGQSRDSINSYQPSVYHHQQQLQIPNQGFSLNPQQVSFLLPFTPNVVPISSYQLPYSALYANSFLPPHPAVRQFPFYTTTTTAAPIIQIKEGNNFPVKGGNVSGGSGSGVNGGSLTRSGVKGGSISGTRSAFYQAKGHQTISQ